MARSSMAEDQRCSCILIIVPFVSALLAMVNAQLVNLKSEQCDFFQGEWVPNPSEPAYKKSCRFIDDNQNCLQNGRPDRLYLHWRWKPYDCELPPFDPAKFLKAVTGKSLAFIGDSIIRNQKSSLMCLLSKVEEPLQVYSDELLSTWYFPSHNFTVAIISSPFLLQPDDPVIDPHPAAPINLHLDIPDIVWTNRYGEFDYVVIGAGPWFQFRVTFLYENNTLVGCHRCNRTDVPELGTYYPYRRALELSFRFAAASEHKPLLIYRIHAPSHFEHGDYYNGGYCNRTVPFSEGGCEVARDEVGEKLQAVGREEFAKAVASGGDENGVRLEMLDVYHLSMLRPDGHPNCYKASRGAGNDCAHWCSPGPIDTWNDLLAMMIFRYEDARGIPREI